MGHLEAVLRVAAICLAFGILHSIPASDAFKRAFSRAIGLGRMRAYYRLGYTLASVLTFALAYYLLRMVPDVEIYRGPLWYRALMHAAQLTGLGFGVYALGGFSGKEFLGLAQASSHLRGRKLEGDIEGLSQGGLVTTGAYAIVRNPLYLAGIVIVSFQPVLTRNWLVVAALADAYFVFGALIEERRMVERFGDEYREYMKRVPRLVPYLWRKGRSAPE